MVGFTDEFSAEAEARVVLRAMPMRFSPTVLLAVALVACATPSSDPPEHAPEVAESNYTALTPEQRADALVAVLNEPGALLMPPLGVEHHANEMEAKVKVATVDGTVEQMLVKELGYALGPDYYGGSPEGGLLSLTEIADTHFTIEFGFEHEGIKSFLKESLVSDGKRMSVAQRLRYLPGTYTRLHVYNASADSGRKIFQAR
jgi:hypothetical protein